MAIAIYVQPEFGYVILMAAAAFFLNMLQMVRIGMVRKACGVEFPAMWSDKHPEFNRAQRVHQNTLESVPFFLLFLLVAGLQQPKLAATFGAIWVGGRVLYSIEYYMDAKKRLRGYLISGFLGLLPLVILSVYSAAGLLGWV